MDPTALPSPSTNGSQSGLAFRAASCSLVHLSLRFLSIRSAYDDIGTVLPTCTASIQWPIVKILPVGHIK
eukprot:6684359-Karenia_brevis.AAC.1